MRPEALYPSFTIPIVVTDSTLRIEAVSVPFCQLVGVADPTSLRGRAVSEFLAGVSAPPTAPKVIPLSTGPVMVVGTTLGSRYVWRVERIVGVPLMAPRGAESLERTLQRKLTVTNVTFAGKRALIRVDFNVPIDKQTHKVIDATRIHATIPTLRKILGDGGSLVLMSHLGRPKGREAHLSLRHIIPTLERELGRHIIFAPDTLKASDAAAKLSPGAVLLLENVRFEPAEDSKVKEERLAMARVLASYADIFVSDAFGTAHRKSASMTGVPEVMGFGLAGLLMCKEVESMRPVVLSPQPPIVAVLGGAKVSDKITLLGALFKKAQTVLIGGAMAFAFLEAQGHSVGSSKAERTSKTKGGQAIDLIAVARDLLRLAEVKGVRVLLPIDHHCAVAGSKLTTAPVVEVDTPNIPQELAALDIGPKTVNAFSDAIRKARTIIWNGPMGLFEVPAFAVGSYAIARAIASNDTAVSVVGGGETAACAAHYRAGITHISTGGAATLELLEGRPLPGLTCLTSLTDSKL